MIQCRLKSDGFEISGHAHYAEKGKDIVCAAVSTLVNAFVLSEEKHIRVWRKPGPYIRVEWDEATEGLKAKIDMVYDELLEMSYGYGQFIQIEELQKP